MTDKIKLQIESGIAPLHLHSLKRVATSSEETLITKFRESRKYGTKHLQIGTLYKSAI